VLWQIVGMLAVVTVIALSIALHEFGHLVPAKRFKVRVSDYAIGFGPSLYSRRFGETLFAIRAIPLGGPFMNLLFATVLFGIALVGIGVAGPTTTIDTVSPCWFTEANPDGLLDRSKACAGQESAASQAGLTKGQTLVAVNGQLVKGWMDLAPVLEAAAQQGGDGTITVRNADGSEVTRDVTFQVLTFDRYDDEGNATGETYKRAIIGITSVWASQHLPITTVPRVMWSMTVRSLDAMSQFPNKLVELGKTLITDGERDPNGPVSVVGVTRIGGEIAAAPAATTDKVLSLLMLAGSLNLFLFLFNLLPLLPLDGGHVAAAAWEAVRDGARRLRGHTSGGPVDTARLLPLTYAMSTVLIAFGGLVIWADIVKPITLGG